MAWFSFEETKFCDRAVIFQRQRFNLLLAAMLEKIQGQIMDVAENMP
jgi:hypothetical protein